MSGEVAIAILSVIVGVFLGWVGQYVHSSIDRGRRAKYLAIRATISLDSFVSSCASALSGDPPLFDQNLDPNDNFDLPEQLLLPDDVDWTSIPISLARQILEAQYTDVRARDSVAFYWQVGGGDQARQERDEQFIKLGLKAVEIASELRRRYRIEAIPVSAWNPHQVLEDLDQEMTKKKLLIEAEAAL